MSKKTTPKMLLFIIVLVLTILTIGWFMSNVDSGYLPRFFQRLF